MEEPPEALCLRDYLHHLDSGSVVWDSGRVQLTAGDLRKLLSRHQEWADELQGAKIAIGLTSRLGFAFLLTILDGLADALLLLPPDEPPERISDFLTRAEIDLVVSDDEAEYPIRGISPSLDFDTAALGGKPEAETLHARASRWIIPTSGTTDVPKLVNHTLASLARAIRRSQAYASYRWGLLYDLSRFAGLQVYLQSLVNGSTLILTPIDQPLEEQIAVLVKGKCNALSATPTLWRKILMTASADELELDQITLGGEIVDLPILRALARAYPAAHITQIYASTEAGVGFAIHDGLEGFPASFLEEPPAGVEIHVDREGLLHLRPKRVEQSFLGESDSLSDEEGWINTGDLVERVQDRFVFLGRVSGSINVGGNKVHPEEVERIIHQVPGVALAVVRARRSSFTGSLVEVVIVPEGPSLDGDALKASVKSHCRRSLPAFKVPAVIKIEDHLDSGAAGKINRE